MAQNDFLYTYLVIFANYQVISRHCVNLKYNFVETPRKFIMAELSIRKLGSSSVLIIMHYY